MNENFILHVVQCVSDYFAPHVAKMQQILSESPNKYIDINCRRREESHWVMELTADFSGNHFLISLLCIWGV